jgi:hypothetical protein
LTAIALLLLQQGPECVRETRERIGATLEWNENTHSGPGEISLTSAPIAGCSFSVRSLRVSSLRLFQFLLSSAPEWRVVEAKSYFEYSTAHHNN